MTNIKYEYYEDNGGGLHLFVKKDGEIIDGITNLEYAGAGEWNKVKDGLNKDAIDEVHGWDGHMRDNDINPQDFYNSIMASEYGYVSVCTNGTLHIDGMGRAAQKYFGVDAD